MSGEDREDELVRGRMQAIARYVERETPFGWGFVVLCFPFGAGGRMNYVSNSKRDDVVRAMCEFIQHSKEAGWAKHEPDLDERAQDEVMGRLMQDVARLEKENEELKAVLAK